MFRSSIAKILINVLFLKTMLFMFIEKSLYSSIFSLFFLTFPQNPGEHLRTLWVTPVCRGTPLENRCPRRKFWNVSKLCKALCSTRYKKNYTQDKTLNILIPRSIKYINT